jgi:hypothetical protein
MKKLMTVLKHLGIAVVVFVGTATVIGLCMYFETATPSCNNYECSGARIIITLSVSIGSFAAILYLLFCWRFRASQP